MLDLYMPTSSSAFLQVFLLQLPQLTVNWTTSVLIIRVTNIYRHFSPLGGAANKIICYLNFIHQCDIDVSSETANQCAKQSKSNHATPLRLDLPFRETRHDYTCLRHNIYHGRKRCKPLARTASDAHNKPWENARLCSVCP